MFQQTRTSSTPPARNLRLSKQSAIPGYGDIEFIMEQAHRVVGKAVELPYSTGEKDKPSEFLLSVRCDSSANEPIWTLVQMSNDGDKVLWDYASRDLTLMCNLVSTSSGSEILEDLLMSGATKGQSADMANTHDMTGTQTATTTAQVTGIVFEAPKPGLKAILDGDLKNLPMPNLLKSINTGNMTGRLDVRTQSESAEVFFVAGTPVHSAVKEVVGDPALIELVTWKAGEFRFWPDETTTLRTISKPIETLIHAGIALVDQAKYLETNGLRFESCLIKKNAMISENELKTRLTKGAPIEFELQLDFYELIDNRTTLFELLRKRPLAKGEWTPILFNLVSCGLIQITDQAPQQNRLASFKSLGIDEAAIQGITKNLIRSETGILTFPAFIYFLDQEYLRYEFFNWPFSIMVFSMGYRKTDVGVVEPLQMLAVRRAMQRIGLVKRQVDLLGHYEATDYAMLLPNTNAAAATALAHRIVDVLKEAPLSSELDPKNLYLAFGTATVPEDCQKMDKLLISAGKARDKAKSGQYKVVPAREIGQV